MTVNPVKTSTLIELANSILFLIDTSNYILFHPWASTLANSILCDDHDLRNAYHMHTTTQHTYVDLPKTWNSQKQVGVFPYLKTRRLCVLLQTQVHYLKLPQV